MPGLVLEAQEHRRLPRGDQVPSPPLLKAQKQNHVSESEIFHLLHCAAKPGALACKTITETLLCLKTPVLLLSQLYIKIYTVLPSLEHQLQPKRQVSQ